MDVVDFFIKPISFIASYPTRKVVMIHLNKEGKKVITEAAPYPCLSSETLDEVMSVLVRGQEKKTSFASLAFALSAANLTPLDAKLPLATLFTPENVQTLAPLAKSLGIKTAKLKIGTLTPEKAIPLIHQLAPDFSLRLDVNHQWNLAGLHMLAECSFPNIEYIEDPYLDLKKLGNFPLPVALDFSYRQSPIIPKHLKVVALIMKPTLDGGIEEYLERKKICDEYRLDLILSSCFESPIGLKNIALMQAHFNPEGKALGLGTLFYLKNPHPFTIRDGYLHLSRT